MQLDELTSKIKINRRLDAENVSVKDLLGKTFTIFDYEIRKSASGASKWIKLLIGYPEIDEAGFANGNVIAAEFHGTFAYLIEFLESCERVYTKEAMLPITDVTLQNSCGVIFRDSTNKMAYIDRLKPPSVIRTDPFRDEPVFPMIPSSIPIPKAQLERDSDTLSKMLTKGKEGSNVQVGSLV